jgi:flagellar L-ring protein precursor FlgH
MISEHRPFGSGALAGIAALIGVVHVCAAETPTPVGASFFADHRARSSGDVLTVLITENSSATESARTETDKTGGPSASVTTPALGQRQYAASLGTNFNGGGQVQRTGQLLARVSVVVDRIDDSGRLWVRGEQDIEINGEHQRIHLEGGVRPDDIAPDNTVPSWRVVDARIALIGKGVLGRSQTPGLLNQILHWLHLD